MHTVGFTLQMRGRGWVSSYTLYIRRITGLWPDPSGRSWFLLWSFHQTVFAAIGPSEFNVRHVRSLLKVRIYKESQGDSTFPVKHLRKEACLDKLHDWLCLPIQGRALHLNLVVSEDLTGAMEQKRWRLVSTNEKWQMHKSFRLCYVMGSAWHSLGLFSDSSPKNCHGFLMPSLTSWNGPSCCCRVLLILKKKLMFWKGKHYSSIFLIISLPEYIKVITMFGASGSISLLCQ